MKKLRKESFNSVPYNAFQVPENDIKTVYEEETETLEKLLHKSEFPDYKEIFTKEPHYFKFEYQQLFEQIALDNITNLIKMNEYYKDDKITIVKSMYDIYWIDTNDTRHFIFNIDINNPSKAFVRQIQVFMKLKNISKYLTDKGEFNSIVKLLNNDVELVGLRVTKQQINVFDVKPIEDSIHLRNEQNYLRTLNTMYLLDPFITNNRNMKITDEMKLEFEKVMDAKNQDFTTKYRQV